LAHSSVKEELGKFARIQFYILCAALGLLVLLSIPIVFILLVARLLFISSETLGSTSGGMMLYAWIFLKMLAVTGAVVHIFLLRYLFYSSLERCFFTGLRDAAKGSELVDYVESLRKIPAPSKWTLLKEQLKRLSYEFLVGMALFCLWLLPGVNFFLYPSVQFLVLHRKLGFRRAVFMTILTCIPATRGVTGAFLQVLNTAMSLTRELLDPALVRMRSTGVKETRTAAWKKTRMHHEGLLVGFGFPCVALLSIPILGCGGWLLVQSTVAWLWVEMYAEKTLNKQTDEMNSGDQLDIVESCNPLLVAL